MAAMAAVAGGKAGVTSVQFWAPWGTYTTIFVSVCWYTFNHKVQRTCRECYWTYKFIGCALSECKGRAAMPDVAVVVAGTMNSGAVIEGAR